MPSLLKSQPLVHMRTVIIRLCRLTLLLAVATHAVAADKNPLSLSKILYETKSGHIFDALLKLNNLEQHKSGANNLAINKNDLLLAYGLSLQVESSLEKNQRSSPKQQNHTIYLLAKLYEKKQ